MVANKIQIHGGAIMAEQGRLLLKWAVYGSGILIVNVQNPSLARNKKVHICIYCIYTFINYIWG